MIYAGINKCIVSTGFRQDFSPPAAEFIDIESLMFYHPLSYYI